MNTLLYKCIFIYLYYNTVIKNIEFIRVVGFKITSIRLFKRDFYFCFFSYEKFTNVQFTIRCLKYFNY